LDDKELLETELRHLVNVHLLRVDGEPGEVRQTEALLTVLGDAMLPFAVFLLILSHLAKEQSVVELLLALLDHLGELVRHRVADALEESGLLLAQDGHRVLGERDEDTLVAEALVAHVLQIGVALQLQERLEVVVVQGIQRPQ
jgi:hypothetical protein